MSKLDQRSSPIKSVDSNPLHMSSVYDIISVIRNDISSGMHDWAGVPGHPMRFGIVLWHTKDILRGFE